MLLNCGCADAGRQRAAPTGFWVHKPAVDADCPSSTELSVLDQSRRSMVAADYLQPAPAVGSLPPDGMNVTSSGSTGDTIVSWTWVESYRLCYRSSRHGAEPRCVRLPIAVWCQRADGGQHGPYLEWYWNGELAVMGSFLDGCE